MTARDRTIIAVVLVAAALAGVWFVGLAPKRKEAADLGAKIDVARQQLTQVEQSAAQARKAKDSYDRDYATVATLGKAVPKSDAVPSLVYQLQTAAHSAKITFNSVKLTNSGAGAAPTTPAQAVANANGANGASGTSGTGTTAGGGSGSTATNGTSGSTATNGASGTTATPAPATQAATASLPPGAVVGSAGFPTMPFSFVFNGSFFDMERFLDEVQRFVRVKGEDVDVRGRLLSIDGFALNAGPNGFPSVTANVSATAYVMSPDATSAATPPSATATATATTGATAMNGGN